MPNQLKECPQSFPKLYSNCFLLKILRTWGKFYEEWAANAPCTIYSLIWIETVNYAWTDEGSMELVWNAVTLDDGENSKNTDITTCNSKPKFFLVFLYL